MDKQPRVKPDSQRSGVAQSERMSAIIVTVDGSAQAVNAVPVAQSLAKLFAATIHVVHVSPRRLLNEEMCDRLKLTQEQLASSILEQRTGSPASAIIHEAKQWESH